MAKFSVTKKQFLTYSSLNVAIIVTLAMRSFTWIEIQTPMKAWKD